MALADGMTAGDPQVGCYLAREEGAELERYAEGLELSRRRLCGLLIVRELRLNRVAELSKRYAGSGSKKGAARVTARVSSSRKTEFAAHVAKAVVGSDDAAAVIFRAELAEKWLAKAVSQGGNRS